MADFSSINVGDALPSKSLSVDQTFVNEYADICGDYNTLHVDVEGMKDHPLFGGTIAHGFLTLSLLSHFAETAGCGFEDMVMGINYGFDKVRFLVTFMFPTTKLSIVFT